MKLHFRRFVPPSKKFDNFTCDWFSPSSCIAFCRISLRHNIWTVRQTNWDNCWPKIILSFHLENCHIVGQQVTFETWKERESSVWFWSHSFKLRRITRPRLAIQKKIQYSAIIRCQIVGQIVAQYSTQPPIKYLYFRRIWWILVESSQIEPRYSCFQPFMGHSQILFDSIFNSIFDSRSSNSTTIHQIYYSALTRLRSRTFRIRLDEIRIPS